MSCSDGAVAPIDDDLVAERRRRNVAAEDVRERDGRDRVRRAGEVDPGLPPAELRPGDRRPSTVSAVTIDRLSRPLVSYESRLTMPPGSTWKLPLPAFTPIRCEDRAAAEDARLAVRSDFGGGEHDPPVVATDSLDQRVVLRRCRWLRELDVVDDRPRAARSDPVEHLRVQRAWERPLLAGARRM